MSSLAAARDLLLDRATPFIAGTKLRAMAAMLRLKPSLRRNLADVHPIAGHHDFRATIQFVTSDGRAGVHTIFGDGRMQVRSGPAPTADLTIRFRACEDMRRFFAGEDTFDMLLDNTLSFEGNLSYLLRFGHISAAVRFGGKKLGRAAFRYRIGP